MSSENYQVQDRQVSRMLMFVRSALGGVLMGLANLVPGISGGTMLLAAGVYPPFIQGVAEVSTFKFRLRTVLFLGFIIGAAVMAIFAFAGIVSHLVIHHRWVMYSLFIGLTLGGVPVLRKMIKPIDGIVLVMAVVGIAVMAVLAFIEPGQNVAGADRGHPYVMLFVAGVAGGSAMILPGVSGGYLLLILGQYVLILSSIDELRQGMSARDWELVTEAMYVIIPVGVGVVTGVVGVSNLVKLFLNRYERATLGFLLGLLLGAILGLWPFRMAVTPEVGDIIRGIEIVRAEMIDEIEPKYWPTARFSPSLLHVVGSIGLIVFGFLVSLGVSRIGGDGDNSSVKANLRTPA